MSPLKALGALNPAQRTFSLFEEFKAFAFKGNVIDLAIGVIIGAAFGKIVESLVKDVFMPLIAMVLPGGGYETWEWRGVHYGQFIAQVINFLIIALALFLFIVKFLDWIMKSKKQEVAAPPPPTKEEQLLTEIRDLLKKQQPSSAGG